jgi:hypothetical protein
MCTARCGPAGVLGGRADVEHDGVAGLDAVQQFVGVDRGRVVPTEIGGSGRARCGGVVLRDSSQMLLDSGEVISGQGAVPGY